MFMPETTRGRNLSAKRHRSAKFRVGDKNLLSVVLLFALFCKYGMKWMDGDSNARLCRKKTCTVIVVSF